MHIVTRVTTLFVLALVAANARALSYECDSGGELVYQEQPCEGVTYTDNLTKSPSQGGTNAALPELLAAQAQARENLEFARARKAYTNRQSWMRQSSPQPYGYSSRQPSRQRGKRYRH